MAETRLKCLSCGAMNVPGGQHCAECGGPLFRDVVAPTTPTPTAYRSRPKLHAPSLSAGALLFGIVAILAGLAGIVTLSNATMGVGFLAASCCSAIFARIAQSSHQHAELIERIDAVRADLADRSER